MEEKKLTPMKFLPEQMETPWGSMEYKLADLGFVDSLCGEGWLSGNNLSDIMQTYLERVVGENAFEWYGTQFPVLVKRLQVKGRSSLHVNPDDETAAQRYDAFGKLALWYVEAAGPQAKLFLGFKRPVQAARFYEACREGTVEELLHTVKPQAGELYLVRPGLVHAAQDVTLLEVAEASELCFRLYDWGSPERESHLEEAFDLVDFSAWRKADTAVSNTVVTEAFSARMLPLDQALTSRREPDDCFLLYIGLRGTAVLRADGKSYEIQTGEVLLVPAEVGGFDLLPSGKDVCLLEVRIDPRQAEENEDRESI